MLIYKEQLPDDTLMFTDLELYANTLEEAMERIISIGMQYDTPMVWFNADSKDTTSGKKAYEIICLGTGHYAENLTKKQYLGTLPVGPYIFHYFLTEGTKRKDMLLKFAEDIL